MVKYCSSCGKQIPDNVKFCPYCGVEILDNVDFVLSLQKVEKKEEEVQSLDSETHEVGSEQTSGGSKILYTLIFGAIGIIGIIFLFLEYVNPEARFSKSAEIEKLIGTWYDPTGVLLGKKNKKITIVQDGDYAIGGDADRIMMIRITPTGINRYKGNLTMHGVDSNNNVRYEEKNGKLIFVNTLSKMDLSIRKIRVKNH